MDWEATGRESAGRVAGRERDDVAIVTVQSDVELSRLVRRLVGSGVELVEVAPLKGAVAEVAAALSAGKTSAGSSSAGSGSGGAPSRGAP